MNPYSDLLSMPHPEPRSRQRMSKAERAAQFLPYATLEDYFASVDEQNRDTVEQVVLSGQETEALDRKLRSVKKGDALRVTYFVPDGLHAGGRYVTTEGRVRSLDVQGQCLRLEDGQSIAFSVLLSVDEDENCP